MTTAAQRLDALIDKRRLELGLRWKGIAERAGITHQTLLQLRKGEPVSDLTVARTEQALQWQNGSIQRILEGGDPLPAPSDEKQESTERTVVSDAPVREGETLEREDGPKGSIWYTLTQVEPFSRVGAAFDADDDLDWVLDELRRLQDIGAAAGIGQRPKTRQTGRTPQG